MVVRLGMPVPQSGVPSPASPKSPAVILQSGIVPDLPYPGPKRIPENDPDLPELKEMRRAAETLLQKLRDDPAFKKRIEEVKPIIRQRIETGEVPAPSAPSLRGSDPVTGGAAGKRMP